MLWAQQRAAGSCPNGALPCAHRWAGRDSGRAQRGTRRELEAVVWMPGLAVHQAQNLRGLRGLCCRPFLLLRQNASDSQAWSTSWGGRGGTAALGGPWTHGQDSWLRKEPGPRSAGPQRDMPAHRPRRPHTQAHAHSGVPLLVPAGPCQPVRLPPQASGAGGSRTATSHVPALEASHSGAGHRGRG